MKNGVDWTHHLKASFPLLTLSHPAPLRGIHSISLKSFHRNILKNIYLNRILSIIVWIADIFKIFLPKAIFDL